MILTALIFLLPLASLPAFSQWHDLGTILMEVGAAVLLAFRVWEAPQIPCLSDWPRSGPLPWLFALLLWSGVCIMFAADKRLALSELLQIGAGVSVYCAVQRDPNSRRIKSLLDALLGMILLVSLAVILAAAAAPGQSTSGLTDQNRHIVWNAATHLGHVRTQTHTQIESRAGFLSAHSPVVAISFLLFWLPLLIAVACSPTNLKRRFVAGAAALAAVGALVLTGTIALEPLQQQQADLPKSLLWAAALTAFFISGARALSRLPKGSLRPFLLAGVMIGVATQIADTLLNPTRQHGAVLYFQWLLLSLGMACTRTAAMSHPESVLNYREALKRPWGWARLIGVCLLTAILLMLIAWTQ